MKRKAIAIISMICSLSLAGCGSAEEQKNSTPETTPVQTESVQESTIAEPATDAAETVQETVSETEVFGDVDMAAGSLTMADMVELEIGTDIPFLTQNNQADAGNFENFKILFPGSAYITEYYDNGVRAQSEAIDFILDANMTITEPSNNVRPDMGESQETIGQYVVDRRAGRDGKYGYQISYHIIDPNNNALMILLTINKESEYQDYGDELVAEFAPKFEEVLYSNLQ